MTKRTKNKNRIPPFEVLKIGIDAIKDMMDKENKWQETFEEMFDGFPTPLYYSNPMEAICKMLEILFKDKPDPVYGSHLSWWIFEAEMGKNLEFADSMTDKDGNHIPMRTIEDLYNYYKEYHFNERNN